LKCGIYCQGSSLLTNNTQRDKSGSPQPTVTFAEIHAEQILFSGKSRKISHSVYSDKDDRNDDVNICRFMNYNIITEDSASESSSGCSTLEQLAPVETTPVLPESILDAEDYDDLPTLTRTDNMQSEVEVLSSLKASMLMGQAPVSTEDVQHLKIKIPALK
jgi:hypothetical protein